MKHWKQVIGICLVFFSTSVLADEPVINKIRVQLSVEDWVSTDNAKVMIGVDAMLDSAKPSGLQEEVKTDLAGLGNTDWRVVQMMRSKDNTGVEKMTLYVEGRLPEVQLTQLNKQLEGLNRAGKQYRIANTEFTPTMEDVEKKNAELRDKILKMADEEVSRLKKQYPKTYYFIHDVYFMQDGGILPLPYFADNHVVGLAQGGLEKASVAESIPVSSRIVIRADVVIASAIDLEGSKG